MIGSNDHPSRFSSIAMHNETGQRRSLWRALSQALAGALAPTDIAAVAIEHGIEQLGAKAGSVALLSEDSANLLVVSSVGRDTNPMESWQQISLDSPSPMADAARSGELITIENWSNLNARYPILASVLASVGVAFAALVAAPLKIGDRVIGVMGLHFLGERQFHNEEREQILDIVQQCAQAIEQTYQSHQTRHSVHQAESTIALLDTLITTAPIGIAFLDREARYIRINEVLASLNQLPIVNHIGRTPASLFGAEGVYWERYIHEVLTTNQPIIDLELVGNRGGQRRYCLASYYPVRFGNGPVLGVGVLVQDITARKQGDLARTMLIELGEMLIQIDDPDHAIERATQQIATYLNVDNCILAEIDPERDVLLVGGAYGMREHSNTDRVSITEFGPVAAEMLASSHLVIENAKTDPRTASHYDKVFAPRNVQALVCVPRILNGVPGAVLIALNRTPRRWNDSDVALLRSAADLTWLAVERARLQRQRFHDERRYRALVEAATQAVWTTDARGFGDLGTTWWEELTGQTSAESRSNGWINALHPNDQARVRLAWIEALATGANLQAEFRVRARDGSYRLCTMHGVALRNEQGQTEEWVGTFTDITHTRRDEIARRLIADISSVLATTIDENEVVNTLTRFAVPDFADMCAIYTLDAQGAVRRFDTRHHIPQKTRLLESLGTANAEGILPLVATLDIAKQTTTIFEAEMTFNTVCGCVIDPAHQHIFAQLNLHSYIAVPLHVRERVFGLIQFGITEPGRRFSQQDVSAAEELARRMSLALDNARLYSEAQEALQARDSFLSIAAHELRTPLAVLFGQTQLVQRRAEREGNLSERNQQSLKMMVEQATRLRTMIGDLLDVSRLENGQLHIDRLPLDLRDVVEGIVEQTRQMNEHYTIALTMPLTPVIVQGDALRLEQVLQNLLSNAIKYSPGANHVEVDVSYSHDTARVDVTDHGIGIPNEAQHQLFTRFYRANNAELRQISGVGIGLYIVREIIARHGGEIRVSSIENQGSTFIIELPLLALNERLNRVTASQT